MSNQIKILRRFDALRDYHYTAFVNHVCIGHFDTYEEAARAAEEYLAA